MREYSYILRKFYDAEDVVHISNMQQIGYYLQNENIEGCIKDILVDDNGRVYFVFEKCPLTKRLYKEWNERGQ